jgi:serine/threonine protein kinase
MGDERVVGGRYRLGGRLGQGGMAEVRLGLDVRLGRAVAVKRLTGDLARDPAARALFRSEARSAASLNHPGIVKVFDTGEDTDPITGVSAPYIVMELVAGKTLRSVLRSTAKMPPRRVLRLTQALLDALAFSHDAGVIHQDIKPGNVMLTLSGEVKLMDFGIARRAAQVSAAEGVRGTEKYLSPEQAKGAPTDARSDIYSAGCLMYELLAGRPPFIGGSSRRIIDQHLFDTPVPPSEFNPEVSGEIDTIALRALTKDPADRYQSAREMSADIRDLLTRTAPADLGADGSDRSSLLRVAPPVRSAAAARQSVPARPRPSAGAGPRSSPRRLLLAAAGIAVLLSPVGILDLRDSSQPGVSAVGADLPGITKATRKSLVSRTWLDPNVDTLITGRGGAQDALARASGVTAGQDGDATGSTRSGAIRGAASAKSGNRMQPRGSVKVSTPRLTVDPVKISTPKLTVNPVKISTPKLTVNPVKISTPNCPSTRSRSAPPN